MNSLYVPLSPLEFLSLSNYFELNECSLLTECSDLFKSLALIMHIF